MLPLNSSPLNHPQELTKMVIKPESRRLLRYSGWQVSGQIRHDSQRITVSRLRH